MKMMLRWDFNNYRAARRICIRNYLKRCLKSKIIKRFYFVNCGKYSKNKIILQVVADVAKTGANICNNVSMQISKSKLNKDSIKNGIKNKHIEVEEDHRYVNVGNCEAVNNKDLNFTNKVNIVITSKPVTIIKVKQVNYDNQVAYKGNELLIPTVPINEIVSDWKIINLNNKYIINSIKNEATYKSLGKDQIEFVQSRKSLLVNKSEMLKENEIIRNPADNRYYTVSKKDIIYEKNVIIHINFNNAKLLTAKTLTKFTYDVANDVQITNMYKNEIKPEEYAKIKQDYEHFNQD